MLSMDLRNPATLFVSIPVSIERSKEVKGDSMLSSALKILHKFVGLTIIVSSFIVIYGTLGTNELPVTPG